MKGLESLWRPIAWVSLIGVTGKGMSALCGIMLAYRFGAGQDTDAYLLAKSVPIAAYLILDSVIYNTFVPLLRRPEKTDALFRTLLILFFFGAAALAALVHMGAAQVVALLARGADGTTQIEAVQLQRITAWAIVYAVPASCLKAWNACQGRYVAASLDGFVMSAVLLLMLMTAPSRMGITPIAIALPVAFVILLIIQSGLAGEVLRLRPRAPVKTLPGRYLARLMGPLLLLNVTQQAQVLLVIAIAAFYGNGAVSQVNYSYAIAQLPVGIVDLILFSTLFPYAAHLAAGRRMEELLSTYRSAAMALLLLALPTAGWVVSMRVELVNTLLTRGSFDVADGRTTAALLLGHGVAIPMWLLEALGCRVLFAVGQHRRYLGAVAIRLLAFAALAPLSVTLFDLPGISMAFAGSCLVGASATAWLVGRALPAASVRPKRVFDMVLLLTVTVAGFAISLLARWGMGDLDPVYQLGGSAILVAAVVMSGIRVFMTRKTL